jgi:hypothetical protein
VKIKNTTRYRTDDLRCFLQLGLEALNVPASHRKVKRVEFVPSRRSTHWGCASLSQGHQPARWMQFSLPAPALLDVAALFRVLRHENAHNLGIKHGEMDPALRYCLQGPSERWSLRYPGVEIPDLPAFLWGLAIREKPAKIVPSIDVRAEKRAAHARAMLAKAERRLRLAETVAKRWRRRVKLAEGRRERLAARPAEGGR